MFSNNSFKISKAKIANVCEVVTTACGNKTQKKLVITFSNVEELNNKTILCSINIPASETMAKKKFKLALGLNLNDEIKDVDVSIAMDNEKIISIEGKDLRTVDIGERFFTQDQLFANLGYFVESGCFNAELVGKSIDYIDKLHAYLIQHEKKLNISNDLNFIEFMGDLANIKEKYEKAFANLS